MILFQLACGGADLPPPVAEAPALGAELKALRLAVGRAARDEQAACDAVRATIEMAPKVQSAIEGGQLSWADVQADLPGLQQVQGAVEVDWRELSLATGPGPMSTALVTIGGVAQSQCADPARVERWTLRAPTLQAAPACISELLVAEYGRAVGALLDRDCICALPPSDPTPQIGARLDKLGLGELANRARAWPTQPSWRACEGSGD